MTERNAYLEIAKVKKEISTALESAIKRLIRAYPDGLTFNAVNGEETYELHNNSYLTIFSVTKKDSKKLMIGDDMYKIDVLGHPLAGLRFSAQEYSTLAMMIFNVAKIENDAAKKFPWIKSFQSTTNTIQSFLIKEGKDSK